MVEDFKRGNKALGFPQFPGLERNHYFSENPAMYFKRSFDHRTAIIKGTQGSHAITGHYFYLN